MVRTPKRMECKVNCMENVLFL